MFSISSSFLIQAQYYSIFVWGVVQCQGIVVITTAQLSLAVFPDGNGVESFFIGQPFQENIHHHHVSKINLVHALSYSPNIKSVVSLSNFCQYNILTSFYYYLRFNFNTVSNHQISVFLYQIYNQLYTYFFKRKL